MRRTPLARRAMLRILTGLGLAPGVALSQGAAFPEVPSLVAQQGTLLIRLGALREQGGRLVGRVSLPRTGKPVLGAGQGGPAHRHLLQLVAQGHAAGNDGDLYENRDREHSLLSREAHPQLTHVAYDHAAREAGLDYGPAGPVLLDAPLIGNSSTAIKQSPFWRSLPRLALTQNDGIRTLYQNYLAAQIHVYPSHRDHDPTHGDLIPANTPFFFVSQGSSRSDRPHLEALAMILASLRPETKDYLYQTQMLAPTVQMVFRRSLSDVRSDEAYRSGLAHRSVIPRDQINLMRMVSLANSLTPETVPPMVRLSVLSEDLGREGVDFFGEGMSERLFETPVAISRIWRSHGYTRSMVVSAQDTRDPQGRAPNFLWYVLRGDTARTRIELLDARGERARITVDWQEPRPVAGRRDVLSNRVDIGVFAQTGTHDSMPSFISILLPQHETRQYRAGADGVMRIASLDFRVPADAYADPALFPLADWRDDYSHDAAGILTGWSRAGEAGTMKFDAEGRLLTDGVPKTVRHVIDHSRGIPGRVVLQGG